MPSVTLRQTQTTRQNQVEQPPPCNECGETREIFNEQVGVCEECYDDNYMSCNACSCPTHIDEWYRGADDEVYCDNCYYEYFTSCDCCGESVDNDYIHYRDDVYYCDSCLPDDVEEMTDRLHSRNIPSNSRESETFTYPVRRLVGIEVECFVENESHGTFSTPEHWINVSDGSISPPEGYYGVEMVSSPANGDLLVDNIHKLMRWKRSIHRNGNFYSIDVNRSCGLHVHFNSLDMSAREVAYVGVVYSQFQNILKGMMPKSRQGSNWCRDFEVPINALRNITSEEELIEIYYGHMGEHPSTDKYNDARYSGLNMHSRYYHGSLEFRLHSGTLNSRKIFNWISILNVIIIKGIQLSKDSKKKVDKWLAMPIEERLEMFGIYLLEYIHERTTKFKEEE